MRNAFVRCWVLVGLALSAAPLCVAQDGNAPPVITDITWSIWENIGGTPRGPFIGPFAFDPPVDLANELDIVVATVTIVDPDWTPPEGEQQQDQEPVFIRQKAFWFFRMGYLTPEPPPIPETTELFQPEEGEGYAPGPGGMELVIDLPFTIPEWLGKNQARLRGLIDWDVTWLFEIGVTNEQAPADCVDVDVFANCEPATYAWEFIYAIENPLLAPPNPPAFANAGPPLVVEAGDTVRLDGSETFDGFNVGFAALDENIFEKDNVTYTWEWVFGPGDPPEIIYRDLIREPAVAEVTLNDVGTYRFRLIVDDGVNALPTSDVLVVEVVSAIAENRAPRAVIVGPSGPIAVGDVITLNGTGSSDADGDPLTYRWRQVDELGGNLSTADAQRVFQPVGGLESAISSWQAIRAGTYYFRLVVTDPAGLLSTDTVSVEVVEAGSSGATALLSGSSDRGDGAVAGADENNADNGSEPGPVAPACGGGIVPLGLLPLMLWPLRGRVR